jgi:hypothetical protein
MLHLAMHLAEPAADANFFFSVYPLQFILQMLQTFVNNPADGWMLKP